MNYDEAFVRLLGHEGDFVDHPSDPGGATRWGITERVARANGYDGPMRQLPVEIAKRIAKKDYWDAVRADELPAAIRYSMFDAAYNSGTRQAILWLQRACGADADGVLGSKTLLAAKTQNPDVLRQKMLAQRLRFMTNLKNWDAFGRGWARRVCDLLEV